MSVANCRNLKFHTFILTEYESILTTWFLFKLCKFQIGKSVYLVEIDFFPFFEFCCWNCVGFQIIAFELNGVDCSDEYDSTKWSQQTSKHEVCTGILQQYF